MTKYVCGFLFSHDRSQVALIQKAKPAWQKDRWNGIGGKIESTDATPEDAMSREFFEETGVLIAASQWQPIITLFNDHYECSFFRAFSDDIYDAQTIEEEHVSLWDMEHLPMCPVIDNLRWLIPLALDEYLLFPVSPTKTR